MTTPSTPKAPIPPSVHGTDPPGGNAGAIGTGDGEGAAVGSGVVTVVDVGSGDGVGVGE